MGRRRVFVSTTKLDVDAKRLAPHEVLLASEERSRAMPYHSTTDRGRYIVRWATLRIGLRRLLGIAAHRLGFAFGLRGKPHVDPASLRPASSSPRCLPVT
jgi:phosphopantetheinyl transferase